MKFFVCGNYLTYCIWSPYILTECSPSTNVLKLWTWQNLQRTPSAKSVWYLKCVNKNDIVKFSKQAFSYKFIVAAILDQKSDIFWCQSISTNLLIHYTEKGRFACEILKLVSGSKPGYAPLNAENGLSVTSCFIVICTWENKHSGFCFEHFVFCNVNLNTQDFVYLEFVKYQMGLRRNMPVFAKCNVYMSAVRLLYIRGSCKKVLSLGSDYFSATFYQTYFYYKPSKYSPFTETYFVTFLPSREKHINSLLLVSVGDTEK